MDKKTSEYVAIYKEQLAKGDIQIAYEILVKYVMSLKAHCEKAFKTTYSLSNVSPGYMDFTYFPFFNDFLRSKKLRFGIVLNHKRMRFELWLMGQNAGIQEKYWNLLKTSEWNKNQVVMPKYSVLEVVLIEEPDFNKLDILASEIAKKAISISEDVLNYIKNIN